MLKTTVHNNFILVDLFSIHLSSNVDINSLYGGIPYVCTSGCSIHSPVILARQKKIVRYTEDFVIERFVISRFHCTMTHYKILPPGKEISEDS